MFGFTLLALGLPLATQLGALAKPLAQNPLKSAGTPTKRATAVSIPLTAPSSANTLARSLVSFSIEGDRWPEWAGINSANTYFKNLLTNLGTMTGRMPEVRVGANSEDHTILDESVNVISTTFPNYTAITPYPEATTVRVSSKYYQLSKWMPAGTHMTWGVNLGSNNVSNAVAETKAIMKTFASGGAANNAGVILDAIEIGNEADLYYKALRPSDYDVNDWKADWTKFAQAVIDGGGLKSGSAPRLILGSFAASDHGNGGFSPQTLYSQGLISGPFGKYINTLSQHHYQGTFCSGQDGLLGALMSKATVRGNISSFDPDIQATVAQGLTYTLGETNSYSCHGAPGVSNTAGAAIWALDYALQAATHNIRRVYFHEGIGFKYNLIQPVTLTRSTLDGHTLNPPLTPHIQPQYYAAVIAAKLIGSTTTSTMSISEISISNSNVGGYAAYANSKLVRAVFLNSNAYLSTSSSRGNVSLTLSGSGSGSTPTTMKVRRLKIKYADDGKGVTFGGKTYETSNGLVSGTEVSETIDFTSALTISDTEAILVNFNY